MSGDNTELCRIISISVEWKDDAFDLIVLLHDEAGQINAGAQTKSFLSDLFARYVFTILARQTKTDTCETV